MAPVSSSDVAEPPAPSPAERTHRVYRGLIVGERRRRAVMIVAVHSVTIPGLGVRIIDGLASPLRLRTDLRSHSPTGFAWGYGGSGPSQLALALLADALGDDLRAEHLYMAFKDAFVHRLDGEREWQVSVQGVRIIAEMVDALLARGG